MSIKPIYKLSDESIKAEIETFDPWTEDPRLDDLLYELSSRACDQAEFIQEKLIAEEQEFPLQID